MNKSKSKRGGFSWNPIGALSKARGAKRSARTETAAAQAHLITGLDLSAIKEVPQWFYGDLSSMPFFPAYPALYRDYKVVAWNFDPGTNEAIWCKISLTMTAEIMSSFFSVVGWWNSNTWDVADRVARYAANVRAITLASMNGLSTPFELWVWGNAWSVQLNPTFGGKITPGALTAPKTASVSLDIANKVVWLQRNVSISSLTPEKIQAVQNFWSSMLASNMQAAGSFAAIGATRARATTSIERARFSVGRSFGAATTGVPVSISTSPYVAKNLALIRTILYPVVCSAQDPDGPDHSALVNVSTLGTLCRGWETDSLTDKTVVDQVKSEWCTRHPEKSECGCLARSRVDDTYDAMQAAFLSPPRCWYAPCTGGVASGPSGVLVTNELANATCNDVCMNIVQVIKSSNIDVGDVRQNITCDLSSADEDDPTPNPPAPDDTSPIAVVKRALDSLTTVQKVGISVAAGVVLCAAGALIAYGLLSDGKKKKKTVTTAARRPVKKTGASVSW